MALMTDKVALVVGGTRGIGLAVSQRLASEGAVVFVTGRHVDEVQRATEIIGRGARGFVSDASVPHEVAGLVAKVKDGHGKLDALVLDVGNAVPAALADATPEHPDQFFACNVRSVAFSLWAAVEAMTDGASVVLVGSIIGPIVSPPHGTYAATRVALLSYARTWTDGLAPRGIRVNVVSPGLIDEATMTATSDQARAAVITRIPLGRTGRPEEIAGATAFLLSDDASYIAGVELRIDGGLGHV